MVEQRRRLFPRVRPLLAFALVLVASWLVWTYLLPPRPRLSIPVGGSFGHAFTADSGLLIANIPGGGVGAYDASNGRLLQQFPGQWPNYELSPDGHKIALVDSGNKVYSVRGLRSGRELGRLQGVEGDISHMRFSADGKVLLIANLSGGRYHIKLWWFESDDGPVTIPGSLPHAAFPESGDDRDCFMNVVLESSANGLIVTEINLCRLDHANHSAVLVKKHELVPGYWAVARDLNTFAVHIPDAKPPRWDIRNTGTGEEIARVPSGGSNYLRYGDEFLLLGCGPQTLLFCENTHKTYTVDQLLADHRHWRPPLTKDWVVVKRPNGKHFFIFHGANSISTVLELTADRSTLLVWKDGAARRPNRWLQLLTPSQAKYGTRLDVYDVESESRVTRVWGYLNPRFSPDGKMLAACRETIGGEVFLDVYDLPPRPPLLWVLGSAIVVWGGLVLLIKVLPWWLMRKRRSAVASSESAG